MPEQMPMTQPNILIMMTDTQPTNIIGCYSGHDVHTDELDRLAQENESLRQAKSLENTLVIVMGDHGARYSKVTFILFFLAR